MKIKIVFLLVFAFGLSFALSAANPHAWSGEKQRIIWKNWSVSINAGITSYYGDLSYFDSDFAGKFQKESEPAFSFMLNKQFSEVFGVAGQILYGGLSNENSNISDFRTNFLEYNIQGRMNLIEMMNGDKTSKFGFTVFAGIGQFLFRTVDYTYDFDGRAENIHNTGVPEFVYFGGGELSYTLNNRIAISADLAVRQAQNDKLDNVVQGNNFDYYTFASIGITYRFKDLFGTNKLPNLTRYEYTF